MSSENSPLVPFSGKAVYSDLIGKSTWNSQWNLKLPKED